MPVVINVFIVPYSHYLYDVSSMHIPESLVSHPGNVNVPVMSVLLIFADSASKYTNVAK